MNLKRALPELLLLLLLAGYTAFAAGPFVWTAVMSLRTTSEIMADPYALPAIVHWEKFPDAWVRSNYATYFKNSVWVSAVCVVFLSLVGAMAAHCLARYRFPGNRIVFFLVFSTIILPPQITVIGLFQILADYKLIDTHTGLILVYISMQLPLTIYILESFFARIPQELYDAARMDGYSDLEIFWRITLPIGMPAIATTAILNIIYIWNEFLYAVVLLTSDAKRTLPLGIQRFMGDQLEDIGMLATGLMIAVIPVIVVYVLFSEKMIQGMTAGAVK
ncbi:MAG: carbohydrate ABC transporter permease [Pseudomonadota bacterium]|nr:carbohydrate ABC transporter permease [Pseudomonadota bacterium]